MTTSYAMALSYNYTWQYESQMREYPYREYYRTIFYANCRDRRRSGCRQRLLGESKEQILGEAYAMRAYTHFDLVNLYGKPYDPATAATDRGIVLSTYIDIEQKYRPTNVAAVYEQIVEDIGHAERLMTVEKQEEAALNYRFSLDAATGPESPRVALYARLAGGLRCCDLPAAEIRTGRFQDAEHRYIRERQQIRSLPAVESDLSGSHIGLGTSVRRRRRRSARCASILRTRSSDCSTKRRTTAATTSTR